MELIMDVTCATVDISLNTKQFPSVFYLKYDVPADILQADCDVLITENFNWTADWLNSTRGE